MTEQFIALPAPRAAASNDKACGCGADCRCGQGCSCGRNGKCAPGCDCGK